MTELNYFKGIIPPVSSIVDKEGNLKEKEMALLIDKLIEEKVNGLFFLGTGGEFSQMFIEERKAIAEFAVKYVDKRVPVLIGIGSANTREALQLSQHAEQIGADGIVAINPYYWNLTEENLYTYFSDIAKSVKLPVLLYNFPTLTGQDLTPDFVGELVLNHKNIVGIKETIDSIGHIREMIDKVKKVNPNFSVFCGFDDHLFNTLLLGGDGAISASANFAPQLSVGIYNAFLTGDFEKAVSFQKHLSILPQLYKIDSPFVNVVKEASELCGIDITTEVLPPTKTLSAEKKQQVKEILQQAKLL
ncbi:dihydrodipicolinate synthase family protein [Niallia sp. Sow4_A1]|uniref:Dihydrodipicolinate synthase family protein n=1 Tax=Niallia hominis TaxID=3133173 RepID=A0ABV1F4Q9_9BACI|nr:dihydrodipicolinate synthase family protein [Bacillus sp. 522_BSPC]